MALKDWKKIENSNDQIVYDNINTGRRLYIQFIDIKNKYWNVNIGAPDYMQIGQETDLGNFKTKSEALKYALGYMRTH